MDVVQYISVLAVVMFGHGQAGGHGGSHHDHIKVHVPEFIHHDHHTKIITIHHHHHKPKEKHHHHHHHHHHKPHVPYGHHYHKHHKKSHTKTHTSTTNHGQGHQGHHGISAHHNQVKHHGQTAKHHDPPSFSYDPNPVTFEDDVKSFAPFAPSIPLPVPKTPQVYGVQHTVKQVKVFDSLPGALPGALPGNTGSHGYEVTEEGEQDDDTFTAINSLSQSYPGTYDFVRSADKDPAQNEVYADFQIQNAFQVGNGHASGPQSTSYADESLSNVQADPFSSLTPTQDTSAEYIPETAFDEGNAYVGDITSSALLSPEDALNENTPVSFSREAGIQESFKTGDVETVVY